MEQGRWQRRGVLTVAWMLVGASCAAPRAEPEPPPAGSAPPSFVEPARPTLVDAAARAVDAGPLPIDASMVEDARPTEDAAASARVQAMLAALPAKRLREHEVCARLQSRALVVPGVVFTRDDAGALHLVSTDERGSPVVLPCDRSPSKLKWKPDAEWTPVLTCDAKLPKCDFAWVSGGKMGTPIPPTERTYWFDTSGGGLRLVAVEVSAYQ